MKLLQEEQDKVFKILLQKLVSKRFSQKELDETDDKIKNLDIEKLQEDIQSKDSKLQEEGLDKDIKAGIEKELEDLKKTKDDYDQYQKHILNIENAQKAIDADVFAYKAIADCEDEITELLK